MGNADLFYNKMFSQFSQSLNVAMIGKVDNYNPQDNTATIIPQHRTIVDGVSEPFAPLVNIPVATCNIGGYSIKFPVQRGDYMIILFFNFDIDNVLIDGTISSETDRLHDLNDCIALPFGFNFLQNTSYNQSNDLTISKNNGNTYIKIKENGDIVLNNSGNIYLGTENASTPVVIEDGGVNRASTKIFGK